MTPKIKAVPMFAKFPSAITLSKKGVKKINEKMQNIPVLTIGTRTLAMIRPRILFLFLSKLYTKPAINPASVHLSKHTMTVATGLSGIKIAKVDGENKVISPLKKPNTAPDNGPHNTAAITMATKEILMLTRPNCK